MRRLSSSYDPEAHFSTKRGQSWVEKLDALSQVNQVSLHQTSKSYRGLAKTHLQHVLTAAAINMVRIASWTNGTSGPSESTQQILSDPTQHNFIAELQGDDYGANLSGSIGGALYDSLLKDPETYQGTSTAQTSQNLSIQA